MVLCVWREYETKSGLIVQENLFLLVCISVGSKQNIGNLIGLLSKEDIIIVSFDVFAFQGQCLLLSYIRGKYNLLFRTNKLP